MNMILIAIVLGNYPGNCSRKEYATIGIHAQNVRHTFVGGMSKAL